MKSRKNARKAIAGPRDLTDRRVTQVLEALDDEQAFVREEIAAGRAEPRRVDGSIDRFVYHQLLAEVGFDAWPPEALRAVVAAIVQHAPAGDLDGMAKAARRDRKILAEMRTEEYAEIRNGNAATVAA